MQNIGGKFNLFNDSYIYFLKNCGKSTVVVAVFSSGSMTTASDSLQTYVSLTVGNVILTDTIIIIVPAALVVMRVSTA